MSDQHPPKSTTVVLQRDEYDRLVRYRENCRKASRKYVSSEKGKEKCREANKKRYHHDIEKSRQKARDYYQQNKDRILARRRELKQQKQSQEDESSVSTSTNI